MGHIAGLPSRLPARRLLPRFRPDLHEPRTATAVGRWLGIAFAVCFLTGLWSHFVQHPPRWFDPPATPSWLYATTQGVHVTAGLASVPLLLAKLWVVYPRLFAWPPLRSLAHAADRLSVALLVGAALFEVVTGVLNIAQWYPWPFYFPAAHYAVAWLVAGALCLHLGAKWPVIRGRREAHDLAAGEPTTVSDPVAGAPAVAPEPAAAGDPAAGAGVEVARRRFLAGAFGAAGAVVVLSAGQAVRPVQRLAVLAPRRPSAGPQALPVNRTAAQARVGALASSPTYRLLVAGRLGLSLPELAALPQRTLSLPIACVEGWSASAAWTGVPLRDLLDMAGVPADATVRMVSLERGGLYRTSLVGPHQARHPDTLVALRLRGEPLALDHGYPARLIGPNRPGVQQTKWLAAIEVV